MDNQLTVATNNFLLNESAMKNLVAISSYLAKSPITPKEYYGNVGSCLIACDMAVRTNLSLLMVMQQLAIVNGRPTWSGQACRALIDQSRRYDKPLKVVFVGEKGTNGWGAYAVAYRDGEEFRGTTVTMEMVKQEGWDRPKGTMVSKWVTMPEQMFKYRAATFFAREHCPDILMGCTVEGEAEDIARVEATQFQTIEEQDAADEMNEQLGL